jgi:hypothetical protein
MCRTRRSSASPRSGSPATDGPGRGASDARSGSRRAATGARCRSRVRTRKFSEFFVGIVQRSLGIGGIRRTVSRGGIRRTQGASDARPRASDARPYEKGGASDARNQGHPTHATRGIRCTPPGHPMHARRGIRRTPGASDARSRGHSTHAFLSTALSYFRYLESSDS